MFPQDSANTRFASSMETFSQLEGILVAGYRGIDLTLTFVLMEVETLGGREDEFAPCPRSRGRGGLADAGREPRSR
jgi:hypothetical protein